MSKYLDSLLMITVVLLCAISVPTYAARLINAEKPRAILEIAKGYGSAILKKDSTGDPLIVGRINGTKYGIYFYGCKKGRKCDDIQFHSAWGGVKASMQDINTWNRTKRFGKAFLDKDGDPALEMTVNLDHGVSRDNLDDTFNWWSKAVKGFLKKVLKQ